MAKHVLDCVLQLCDRSFIFFVGCNRERSAVNRKESNEGLVPHIRCMSWQTLSQNNKKVDYIPKVVPDILDIA